MASTLWKKLLVVFSLGLLCFAVIGYILYSENSILPPFNETATSNYAALKLIDNIRAGLKDIETAELGYALSGEKTYLTASQNLSSRLRKNIKELKKVGSSTANEQRIRRLEPLIDQLIQITEQLTIDGTNGKGSASYATAQTEIGRLSEQIASGLTSIVQDRLKVSAYRDRIQEDRIEKNLSLIAASFGVAFLVILCSIAVISRELTLHRRTNHELWDIEERYRFFTEGLKDTGFMMLDPDGTVRHWSAAAGHLQGFTGLEIIGKHYSCLFTEDDLQLRKPEHCLKIAEDEGRYEQMGPLVRKDGSAFEAHSIITALRDKDSRVRGFSVVSRDVTEQKRSDDLLKKLALTVEQAADLVMITDPDGKVEFMNSAAAEVTGYNREELMSRGLGLLQLDQLEPARSRTLWQNVLSGSPFESEMICIGKNGEYIYLDIVAAPIKGEAGNVTHVVFTGSDVTRVKLMRDKLDYLASYDPMTGLPNRSLFAERLNRDLCAEDKGRKLVAVLAIDIDRFKYLNEIYGLEAGNKVLKQVAVSLSVSVNKGDMVGRLGSDEFGISLHDVERPADVVLFVKMILKNVPQIIMSGGEEIPVTLAIGIAVYPADGKDARLLMKNAATALSKAKELGRNRYQFYTPDMNVGISELVFMERRLSDALRNNEYVLAYQPYHHLSSGKVAGAEALLRWNNEEFGLVSPAKFIPMLEETGMIADVGKWVLRTACSQIREWTSGTRDMPISVNLSLSQFRSEYLVETVDHMVREAGIRAEHLTLEITESIFMKDQESAISILQRLKKIGVRISIDDFGTGYSSLSYLKKFPVDVIKIDQSFVRDVATDPDTTALVTAIITMAHGLGLRTIAEGIETEEQGKILRLLKCDMGQGFYFSPGVPSEKFKKLMA